MKKHPDNLFHMAANAGIQLNRQHKWHPYRWRRRYSPIPMWCECSTPTTTPFAWMPKPVTRFASTGRALSIGRQKRSDAVFTNWRCCSGNLMSNLPRRSLSFWTNNFSYRSAIFNICTANNCSKHWIKKTEI